MLGVRSKFPDFKLQACVSTEVGEEFATISPANYRGKWLVLFFWPLDFTFVCPTEIAAFGEKNADFHDRKAQLLGVSTDSQFVHLAWRKSHKDLHNLPFPMLSDIKHELGNACGIIHPEDGVSLRATYIVDPEGVVRYASVNDLKVGRSVDEVLRVLDALQTDELCGCGWKKGQATIKVK